MRLNISRSQVYVALYIIDGLEGICNFLCPKYIFKSKVYIVHHILSRLRDTCNPPDLRYMLRLIFLVD